MICKIRVILDTKEDIFRDIEIKENQTLWNLHNGIKNAFNLTGEELSTFNLLESDGTIYKSVPLEDMSDDGDGEIMSDVYINEVFESQGDKAHFQYGLLDLWEFFCEMVETVEERKAITYPTTVFRFGNPPLKAPGKSTEGGKSKRGAMMMDDEFGFEDFDSGDFSDEDDDSFDDDEDFDDGYGDDVADVGDED